MNSLLINMGTQASPCGPINILIFTYHLKFEIIRLLFFLMYQQLPETTNFVALKITTPVSLKNLKDFIRLHVPSPVIPPYLPSVSFLSCISSGCQDLSSIITGQSLLTSDWQASYTSLLSFYSVSQKHSQNQLHSGFLEIRLQVEVYTQRVCWWKHSSDKL